MSDETPADEMDWRTSAWALTHMRLLALWQHDVPSSTVDAIAGDVVAELEQVVRDQVAQEIEAMREAGGCCPPGCPNCDGIDTGLGIAARIARGGAE